MISQYFPPDMGGSSTRAYNAAAALKEIGCEVAVVTAFPHYPNGIIPKNYKRKLLTREKIHGIEVIRTWVPSIPHSSVRNRMALHVSFVMSSLLGMRYLRKFNVIFAMNPNLFAFYSAAIYGIIFRRKILRNIDDLWPEVFYDLGLVRSRILKKFLDFTAMVSYRYSAGLIPVSSGYVPTLLQKYKMSPEKISVIEHGVDTRKFRRIERRLPNDHSDKKLVMYSGSLNAGHDFETLVEAAKLLESQPVHFLIRGTGQMYGHIQTLIRDYGTSNIEVDDTFLSTEELVALMNTADIFMLPMNATGVIDEGLPTKILEYQALGKPIICISEGEPGRYILQSQSGLVVGLKQPRELAEAIMSLVRDQELCKKLGENGYNHVNNNLTLEMIGKRLLEAIKKSI